MTASGNEADPGRNESRWGAGRGGGHFDNDALTSPGFEAFRAGMDIDWIALDSPRRRCLPARMV